MLFRSNLSLVVVVLPFLHSLQCNLLWRCIVAVTIRHELAAALACSQGHGQLNASTHRTTRRRLKPQPQLLQDVLYVRCRTHPLSRSGRRISLSSLLSAIPQLHIIQRHQQQWRREQEKWQRAATQAETVITIQAAIHYTRLIDSTIWVFWARGGNTYTAKSAAETNTAIPSR